MNTLATQWTVSVATDADRDCWNQFVLAETPTSLCHAYQWKNVVESVYGHRATYLASRDGDGDITGVLPLVHMRGALTGNRLVSMPFLDQGGVLTPDRDARESLGREALLLAARLGAAGIDLRGPGPASAPLQIDPQRPPDGRVTMVLDLPAKEDALWKSFKPKVRNQVRKAEREDLITEPAGIDGVPAFYNVFAINMRDLGSPVHDSRLFVAVLREFGSAASLYLTRNWNTGRIVGGAIAIRFGDTVTVPWASSRREAFRSCPNHSLYWRILRDAVAANAQRFDFGRSRVPSGTYSFKKQWGALPYALDWRSVDRYGRDEHTRHVESSEHSKVVSIWQRLPVALTRVIGPLIRGRLSN